MKYLKILLSSKYRIYTISVLIFILIYIFLSIFYFESDPFISLLSSLANFYLGLTEMFANLLLSLTGSGIKIENHSMIRDGITLSGFIPQIRFKIWMLIFLTLTWITRTTFRERALFTSLLIVFHFFIGSIITAAGAYLAGIENNGLKLLTIPVTLGLLSLFTIIFIWYRRHKDLILNSLSKFKIDTKRFRNDLYLFSVASIYILLYYFLFDIFDFVIWIDLLFTSAQKILALFGYEATVEPFYLIGENGSIFMLKSCLGYQTMLLFASIVFLTGNINNRVRWTFIISGILFINFINIMRFVFLFMHIQKHGDYMLAMDVHEMYNYIIYLIVFVLWVIWFEKFANKKRRIPDEIKS